MERIRTKFLSVAWCAAAALVAGCGGGHGGGGTAMMPPQQPSPMIAPDASVLKMLTKQVVIGSTIDPVYHQLNPYGLDVARSTAGAFTAGDLAVCNFNAKTNVQGTGYTIVALHPVPGSKPKLVAASKSALLGCNALALAPNDIIWGASFVSNSDPILDPTGKVLGNIKGPDFVRPFGQAFAAPAGGAPAFYESNAGNGTVVRINLGSPFTFDVIAKGFAINHGKPGGILGPSGLNYRKTGDILYVVDGTNNTIVALHNVSKIKAGGVIVKPGGKTFGGPQGSSAKLVYAGAPLNGPISSAVFFNGNLAIGNTLDPSGKNLIVEISPGGKLLDVLNVDKGASGSLFGMVATGSSIADTKLFFNDDNDNNLQVLEH